MSGAGLLLLAASPAMASPLRSVSPQEAGAGAMANVCHLKVERKKFASGAQANSTGALIADGRYVLTAAHNVYSPFYNRAKRIELRCGVADADAVEPQRVATYRQAIVAPGYFWRKFHRDFALIRLDTPLPQAVPSRIAPFSAGDPAPVRIAGFPGDDDAATPYNGRRLYSGEGQGRLDGTMLRYPIDTFPGNSGGPVWQDSAGEMRIRGVHVEGTGSSGAARAVDPSFIRDIEAMMRKLEERAARQSR